MWLALVFFSTVSAFHYLLQDLEDLSLDTPDADEVLQMFVVDGYGSLVLNTHSFVFCVRFLANSLLVLLQTTVLLQPLSRVGT